MYCMRYCVQLYPGKRVVRIEICRARTLDPHALESTCSTVFHPLLARSKVDLTKNLQHRVGVCGVTISKACLAVNTRDDNARSQVVHIFFFCSYGNCGAVENPRKC